jgi:hypothetical protein
MASCGMVQVLGVMKTDTVVQTVLRVFFSNFRCCNVGITDSHGVWSTPLRWTQMTYYTSFINIGSGIQKLLKGDTHTDSKVIA